ncbi:NUDIX domain-containing protein [Streptomyces sp. NPDC000410]|uniref:nucleotide triphosphate diphosphatase NUDT15 n=1 Tax=Streptomyces sp. NPDC000410 TaxID=3154254 RepID=UPI003318E027
MTTERPARAFPAPNSLTGIGMIVVAPDGRVLLGLGHDGRWELPGGKVDTGESFERAGVRELAEETALRVPESDVRILAVLMDGHAGITRVTAAGLVTGVPGDPVVTEPDKIVCWRWHRPEDIPYELFTPSAAVLRIWRPELAAPQNLTHCYAISSPVPDIGAKSAGLPRIGGDKPEH